MNDKCPVYEEVRNPRFKKHLPKDRSSIPFAWRLTVVILGVCCLIFLLTTGVLGFKIFQCHRAVRPQKCPLENTKQEDNSTLKNSIFTGNSFNTGGRSGTCKLKWTCCGENCYYFSKESKNFEDSKKFCERMDSKLVKIEDQQELNFIQSQISYFSWIGLSRKGTSSPWAWEDNSVPLLKTLSDWKESTSGNCGSLTASQMTASDCARLMHSICEKKITCRST